MPQSFLLDILRVKHEIKSSVQHSWNMKREQKKNYVYNQVFADKKNSFCNFLPFFSCHDSLKQKYEELLISVSMSFYYDFLLFPVSTDFHLSRHHTGTTIMLLYKLLIQVCHQTMHIGCKKLFFILFKQDLMKKEQPIPPCVQYTPIQLFARGTQEQRNRLWFFEQAF